MLGLFRRAPVTSASWLLLLVVFLGTHGVSEESGRSLSGLRRAWGSVEQLNWVAIHDGHIVDPELYGPFDLWDGEWWRVPLCAFHHVNLVHLLLNLTFVVMFGPWLEVRLGSWRYLLFLIGAAAVSMVPEYLAGGQAVGYSGVCCAIFGALLALRRGDAALEARITEAEILWMFAGLLVMVLLTWIDVLHVANLAHFVGLGYGCLAGEAFRRRTPERIAFVAAHLVLIVPYWFVVHPVWLGRYQWYVADLEQREQRSGDVAVDALRKAVALDPSLARVWRMIANEELQQGNVLAAWDDLLRGLEHNPSDEPQWQAARHLWRQLVSSDEREDALKHVEAQFGSAAPQWLKELRRVVPPPVLIAPHRPPEPTQPQPQPPTQMVEWEPPPNGVWTEYPLPNGGPLPPVNPADAHSALEGELL